MNRAAAGLFLVLSAASPGDVSGAEAAPDLLDAAVTLAEIARDRGDATLLASAGETMRALAGEGADGGALARDWFDEARFLARGESGLLARIDAIEAAPAGGELVVVQISGALATITLPPGEGGILLRAAEPGAPVPPWAPPEQAGRALACAPARTGGHWCAARAGAGPLTLRSQWAGAAPFFAFLRGAPGEDGP